MVKKEVVKKNNEMPKYLRFVYGYNWVRLVLLLGISLLFISLGSSLSFFMPGEISSFFPSFFMWFILLIVVLSVFYWKILLLDFKKGRPYSLWVAVLLNVYLIISSLFSLPEINILLPFEAVALYCLLRKDSREFFGKN